MVKLTWCPSDPYSSEQWVRKCPVEFSVPFKNFWPWRASGICPIYQHSQFPKPNYHWRNYHWPVIVRMTQLKGLFAHRGCTSNSVFDLHALRASTMRPVTSSVRLKYEIRAEENRIKLCHCTYNCAYPLTFFRI